MKKFLAATAAASIFTIAAAIWAVKPLKGSLWEKR